MERVDGRLTTAQAAWQDGHQKTLREARTAVSTGVAQIRHGSPVRR
jgi:hypothetical protein